jgi:hypothetical protein
MKLSNLENPDFLLRPEGNKRSIDDGVYEGETTHAEFQEWESKYSEDGTRVVLSIKVEVNDADGDPVDLYVAPNYSWSSRGNMMKVLENLGLLPGPGERLQLTDLVGIPVQVMVENVEKDGETYSNIIRMKRIALKTSASTGGPEKKVPRKRSILKSFQSEAEKLFNETETDENDYEVVESIDDMD